MSIMFACTISSEPLNLLSPNLVWWCIIVSQSVLRKVWFAIFKVTVKVHMIEIWLCTLSSELLILLLANFGLMAHHHKLGCAGKRLHQCVVLKVKVTAKVQIVNEFSSGPCLLNCWTFCNWAWYGDASSWARVSCEKNWLTLFKVKVTVRASMIRILLFLPYPLNSCSFCSHT